MEGDGRAERPTPPDGFAEALRQWFELVRQAARRREANSQNGHSPPSLRELSDDPPL